MVRVRDVNWVVRLAIAVGTILFAALLLGALPAYAAPPAPIAPTDTVPTDIGTPITPPHPQPCEVNIKCWPPANPCVLSPEVCTPPTLTEPPKTEPPTSEPTNPPTTKPTKTKPPESRPTDEPVGQPNNAPSIIPTPTRVDTGGGPVSEPPTWLFWVVPGMALLTFGSGVAGWWLARSEQGRP